MNSKEYQKEVLRTLNQDLTPKEQIINMALGLTGEAGEVADLVKKAYYQGHDLPKEKLVNEIGDIAWYLTNLCNCIGVELEDVFQANIDKLSKRYKDGFSAAASVDRVDTKDEEHKCYFSFQYISDNHLGNRTAVGKCKCGIFKEVVIDFAKFDFTYNDIDDLFNKEV